MKFSSYQPTVQPNRINPSAVQAPRDLNVYGTGGKEWDALGSAVGQVNKVLVQKRDDEDAADVMDAKNKIMSTLTDKLYNSEDGLLTLGVGHNAKGLTDRVTQAIQDTSKDVAMQYNPRVRYALKSTLNDNMMNLQRVAAAQEQREGENAEQADYTSALNLNAQNAGLTWDVKNSLTSIIGDTKRTVLARGARMGWSGEQVQSEMQGAVTKLVSSAATAAITAKNYDRAADILKYNRSEMDQTEYNRLMGIVKKNQEVTKVYTNIHDIVGKYYNPKTGQVDWEGLDKELRQLSTKKGANGGGANGNAKDIFCDAMIRSESGGDPSATSSVGAYGVLQIMPDNWPSWSKEAGYEGADPNDAAVQKAVGKFKLDQYVDKYGYEGAIVAWYAGPANAERWVNGESTDIWGRPWSSPQPNGPSIQKKVTDVMQDFNDHGGANAGSQDSSGGENGIDISRNIYYEVKPGKEGEVEGLQHSTWAKLNALAALYKQQFGSDKDFEPFYVTAGAATDGHNDGSKHYQGIAFDIAMDSLKRNPKRLEWLQEHAADVGLTPLNEYNGYGNEKYAKGENFHFSDNGSDNGGAFDENAYMGNGGGGESASTGGVFDIEEYNTYRNAAKAEIADLQAQYKENRQQHLNDIETSIDGTSSYSEACQLIDSQPDLTLKEKLSFKSLAAQKFGVNRSTGRPIGSGRSGGSSRSRTSTSVVGSSGAKYTQNQINNARYDVQEYNERINDPNDTISRTDQRRYNKAANLLQDIGEMGSGDNLASEDGLEMARHAIQVTNSDEEAEWYLISNYNYSESEADYYISKVHGESDSD